MRRYLTDASDEDLKAFVLLIGASAILPNEITVVSRKIAGVLVYTCALKLDVSEDLVNYDMSCSSLRSAVYEKSFNSI